MQLLVLVLLSVAINYGLTQECRQVTVCDRETSRGEKGDAGAPGKAGPPGSKGEKGNVGEVGEKGNIGAACEVEEFQREVRAEFAELRQALIPTSCEVSTRYGRQTLKSGDDVFCDGKWTVFQKRFNGSVNFNRVWSDYKNGFGSVDGEFWFGLEKLHLFTKQRGCRVRFDLWSFDGDHAYAEYSDFSVEDESDNYRLHLGGYSGTAGNSMNIGNSLDGMQFSTKDRDNDLNSGHHCASGNEGGWWYRACAHVLLNKPWGVSGGSWQNIVWFDWKGRDEALKETVMKVRCD